MADQRNTNRSRPPQGRPSQSRRPAPSRRRRRRTVRKPALDLNKLLSFRKKQEFKPDSTDSGLMKKLHMTQVQRSTLLRWGLYIAVIVLLTMIQDVIMSQLTLFGTTTDLAACVILLITVLEGTEVGSIFVLIASTLFYFAGSAPGPYSIALLTFPGIGACMFRQLYWHRSRGSIVLCAGLALMVYELGVFGVGIFQGLTRWDRIDRFLITGLLSWLVMIPLYSLIHKIGQIGGHTWKE